MAPKIDRKAQIVQLATEMFSADGYDKVTVKRIALACGVTEPAVYRHYESKEAIYTAVLGSLKGRLTYRETFAKLEDETDLETLLKGLALHIINFYTENAEIYRLLLYAVLRGHPAANETFDLIRGAFVKYLNRRLDELYAKGLIIQKNNHITARCFIGMVFDCAMGVTLWKGMQGRAYLPNEVVANNIPIFVSGLKPRA